MPRGWPWGQHHSHAVSRRDVWCVTRSEVDRDADIGYEQIAHIVCSRIGEVPPLGVSKRHRDISGQCPEVDSAAICIKPRRQVDGDNPWAALFSAARERPQVLYRLR